MKQYRRRRPRKRSALILLLLLVLCSLLVGWGLSLLITDDRFLVAEAAELEEVNTPGPVDAVPPAYQLGEQLYLESCGSCHLALPPQTMPTETWQQLLQDPNHYGARLQLPVNPQIQYIWGYLKLFSRPLKQSEPVPYQVTKSRYFKILHPEVEFSGNLSPASCASCHPGAADFDFRSLSQEWQDTPLESP